jgi:hypothetical protein
LGLLTGWFVQSEKAPCNYYEWFPKAEFCLTIQVITIFRWAETLLMAGEWKLTSLNKNK